MLNMQATIARSTIALTHSVMEKERAIRLRVCAFAILDLQARVALSVNVSTIATEMDSVTAIQAPVSVTQVGQVKIVVQVPTPTQSCSPFGPSFLVWLFPFVSCKIFSAFIFATLKLQLKKHENHRKHRFLLARVGNKGVASSVAELPVPFLARYSSYKSKLACILCKPIVNL